MAFLIVTLVIGIATNLYSADAWFVILCVYFAVGDK